MPRLFLMFEGIEYDFWLLRGWIPGAVSGNCLVTNGLREVWLLCCFDVRWTCLPVLASGGFRYFKGHFRTRWCLRCVFCSVMHHCVVRRSGSVPTEITEPPGGSIVQTRIHRNIAKQRLPSKPTDLRQFPDHSLPGAFFLGAKNHIENRATSETVWAQFIFWCGKFE